MFRAAGGRENQRRKYRTTRDKGRSTRKRVRPLPPASNGKVAGRWRRESTPRDAFLCGDFRSLRGLTAGVNRYRIAAMNYRELIPFNFNRHSVALVGGCSNAQVAVIDIPITPGGGRAFVTLQDVH